MPSVLLLLLTAAIPSPLPAQAMSSPGGGSSFHDGPTVYQLESIIADKKHSLEERFFALEQLAARTEPVRYESVVQLKNAVRGPWLADFVRCLGRSGPQGLALVENYLKRRSRPEVRAEAIYATGRHGDEGEAFARRILRDSDEDQVCRVAALASLADRGSEYARVEALRRLAIEDGALLLQAIKVLRENPELTDAPYLIDLISERDGRAANESVQLLQKLTGYKIGKDPRSWKYWMIKHRSEGTAFRRAVRPGEEEPQTLSYMGIPILGDNVVFVLDSSGSMDQTLREDWDHTRGSRAVEELVRLLPALRPTAMFDLIFFSTSISGFARKLVPKEPGEVDRAVKWLRANKFDGWTNLYGGLERALERDHVEEIILLSDGMPTRGEITDPERILARIARWNRFRLVRINTIALGADSRARQFLYRLAKSNDGVCQTID